MDSVATLFRRDNGKTTMKMCANDLVLPWWLPSCLKNGRSSFSSFSSL